MRSRLFPISWNPVNRLISEQNRNQKFDCLLNGKKWLIWIMPKKLKLELPNNITFPNYLNSRYCSVLRAGLIQLLISGHWRINSPRECRNHYYSVSENISLPNVMVGSFVWDISLDQCVIVFCDLETFVSVCILQNVNGFNSAIIGLSSYVLPVWENG